MENKERVSYSIDQINNIVKLLDKVSVSGSISVTSLAMVYQELNNGEIFKKEIGDKLENKEGE